MTPFKHNDTKSKSGSSDWSIKRPESDKWSQSTPKVKNKNENYTIYDYIVGKKKHIRFISQEHIEEEKTYWLT